MDGMLRAANNKKGTRKKRLRIKGQEPPAPLPPQQVLVLTRQNTLIPLIIPQDENPAVTCPKKNK